MSRITIQIPSRLHFGLLSWGSRATRQFGGVGLMIDNPGLTLSVEDSDEWTARGPLSGRVLEFASRVAERLTTQGLAVPPLAFEIHQAPPEHRGLGVGTQLGLGVARLISETVGLREPSTEQLADLSGRGLRSGIGLHGFLRGGLIVDGGRSKAEGIPPLLTRLEFPKQWSVLVVIPSGVPGLNGPREVQAFASLPPSTDALTDRLCRLVLLGLLPAVVEHDLLGFGEALEEIQRKVGEGFAPVQGGKFAGSEAEIVLEALKREGLNGVGQSSWGPALYGFSDASADDRRAVLDRLQKFLGLGPAEIFWTQASPGAALDRQMASRV